jgi:protein SCO1/2
MASTKHVREGDLNPQERMIISAANSVLVVFFLFLLVAEFYRHFGPPAAKQSNLPNSSIYSSLLVLEPDHPRHLADFNLVDQNGRPITTNDLDQKIVVVNFIFSACSFICPHINAQMAKIEEATIHDPDVHLLSLALDPIDDTVPVLKDYSQKYTKDAKHWSFVTGDYNHIQSLIGESFLCPDKDGEFGGMPGNFINTQRIVLVDKNGDIVEYFDGLNEQASDAIIKKIQELKGS